MGSRPPSVIRTSEGKMRDMIDKLGSEQNFFSLTVYRYDQYLPNGSRKTVAPIESNAEVGPPLPFAISLKTATRFTIQQEFRDLPHTLHGLPKRRICNWKSGTYIEPISWPKIYIREKKKRKKKDVTIVYLRNIITVMIVMLI